jgi:hypothetical protein
MFSHLFQVFSQLCDKRFWQIMVGSHRFMLRHIPIEWCVYIILNLINKLYWSIFSLLINIHSLPRWLNLILTLQSVQRLDYWLDDQTIMVRFLAGLRDSSFSIASRPVTQPPIQWIMGASKGVKRPGHENSPYLVPRSRIRGATPLFPHKSSWCAA